MPLGIGIIIIQGMLCIISFIAGAFVYRRGVEQSPLFSFNPDKKEIQSTQSWDEV